MIRYILPCVRVGPYPPKSNYSRLRINKRSVSIDASGIPASKAVVICEQSELARGIAALLDNAIKYSYRDGRKVFISGNIDAGLVRIVVENYGIGIPPDLVDLMNKRKVTRAEVRDSKVYRTGTGRGLRIAASVFVDQLGGSLRMESEPASRSAPRSDFHRYITRAIVEVPVDTEV